MSDLELNNNGGNVLPEPSVSSTGGEASKYMSGGKKSKKNKNAAKKTQRKNKNAKKTQKSCWWKFW